MKFNYKAVLARLEVASKDGVFGGIILISSNKELDWDGVSLATVKSQLAELKTSVYGKDWKFAGDLTAEDTDANIWVDYKGKGYLFAGKLALTKFIKFLSKI